MNSRRRIRHASVPLDGQPIAARAAWERVDPADRHRGGNQTRHCPFAAQESVAGPKAEAAADDRGGGFRGSDIRLLISL